MSREQLDAVIRSKNFYQFATRAERFRAHFWRSLEIALRSRAARLLRFPALAQMVVTAAWGDPMRVVLPEDAPIAIWGLFEGEEFNLLQYLRTTINEGDVVLDIGAHIGYYTLLLSMLVGSSGQVHAFEPTPRTFKLLSENCHKKQNITLNQFALGAEPGTTTMMDFGHFASAFNTTLGAGEYPFPDVLATHGKKIHNIQVSVSTLDAYCEAKKIKPRFMKLDAEGAEYEILRGAQQMLKAYHPAISVEVWGRGQGTEKTKQIVSLLTSLGYTAYLLIDGKEIRYSGVDDFMFTNLIFRYEKDR